MLFGRRFVPLRAAAVNSPTSHGHHPLRDRRFRLTERPLVEFGRQSSLAAAFAQAAGGVLLLNLERICPESLREISNEVPAELQQAVQLIATMRPQAWDALELETRRQFGAACVLAPLTLERFAAELAAACLRRELPVAADAAAAVWDRFVTDTRQPPLRRGDAGEMVEMALATCRFQQQSPDVSATALVAAASRLLPAA